MVALVAAVGIAWIALSMVANDPIGLIFAFGAIFLLVYCGSFLVIRRGPRRFLVLPPALLALVALITYGYDQKYQMLILAAALAIFGFAARYAARHQPDSAHTIHRHARPAQPARTGVLIINPRSGGGKAARFNLTEEARKRSIEPLLLDPGDDLCSLAKRAATRGADVIGMAGGDGSQALVASVAMEEDVAHVCVPAGTRNHFALDLGLDRDDVVGALDAFTDGVERRIDLARLNERIFVNNASLGIYARVVQSDRYRDAKLGTWRQMLPDVMGQEAYCCDLEFDVPDATDWAGASLVIVSNNPYQLRRFRGAGTRTHLNTGQLGIFTTSLSGAAAVAKLVTLGTIAQQRRFGSVRQWSSVEFEVRASEPVAVGLDGEALLLTPPLRFRSLPGALRVRVPRELDRSLARVGHGAADETKPLGAGSDGRGQAGISRIREVNPIPLTEARPSTADPADVLRQEAEDRERTSEEARLDERELRVQRAFQVPMLIAALLVIPVLVIEESGADERWTAVADVLNWVIWGAFAVEAAVMLAIVRQRWRWIRRHPLEIAIVILTPPFLPASFQALRLFRLFRLLPLLRLGRVARHLFSVEGVTWAALLAVLTTVFAGAAYSSIEKGASSWDGLWWAVSTVTTVGYGDEFPKTTAGRALGMALMLIGIGFVAVLTGAVAGRFLSARIEESQEELSETFQEAELDELEELHEIAERLNALERRIASSRNR